MDRFVADLDPVAPVAQSDQITTDGDEIIQDSDTFTATFTAVTVDCIHDI